MRPFVETRVSQGLCEPLGIIWFLALKHTIKRTELSRRQLVASFIYLLETQFEFPFSQSKLKHKCLQSGENEIAI